MFGRSYTKAKKRKMNLTLNFRTSTSKQCLCIAAVVVSFSSLIRRCLVYPQKFRFHLNANVFCCFYCGSFFRSPYLIRQRWNGIETKVWCFSSCNVIVTCVISVSIWKPTRAGRHASTCSIASLHSKAMSKLNRLLFLYYSIKVPMRLKKIE